MLIVVLGDDLKDDDVGTAGVIPEVPFEVVAGDLLGLELDLVRSREMGRVFVGFSDEREVPIARGVVVIEDDLRVVLEPGHLLSTRRDRFVLRLALSKALERRDEPEEDEQFEQRVLIVGGDDGIGPETGW